MEMFFEYFLQKKWQIYWRNIKSLYLCTRKAKELGYGVMVTLQILVLSFLVRVQVAQQKDRKKYSCGLFYMPMFLVAVVMILIFPSVNHLSFLFSAAPALSRL